MEVLMSKEAFCLQITLKWLRKIVRIYVKREERKNTEKSNFLKR